MNKQLKGAKAIIHVASSILVLVLSSVSVAFADAALNNPLQFQNITSFIANVLKVVVLVSLPIVTLFFVIAGYKFISAQGNPEKLKVARANFLWSVLGALLLLGAWVVATLIGATVSQLVAS